MTNITYKNTIIRIDETCGRCFVTTKSGDEITYISLAAAKQSIGRSLASPTHILNS